MTDPLLHWNAGELIDAVQRGDRAADERGADLVFGRIDDAERRELLQRHLARGDRRGGGAAPRGGRRGRGGDLAADRGRVSALGQQPRRLEAAAPEPDRPPGPPWRRAFSASA